MEKRSRRHIRDLVALAAFQGLSQNEIGCARISMMARSTNAPFKGRIQKRKTSRLQIIKFSLQRTAGPYKRAKLRPCPWRGRPSFIVKIPGPISISGNIGSIPDAIFRLMSGPTTTGAPIIMAAPMPPVAPHDCTRGSTYGCTAAAAHGTSDDCTGNRAAARRTPARLSGAEHRCDPGK